MKKEFLNIKHAHLFLLINFLNEDIRKLEEDYLDSPEWEKIEESTIDRGTELLNLLLYLHLSYINFYRMQ